MLCSTQPSTNTPGTASAAASTAAPWRQRLAAYKHLPQVKPIPAALVPRLGEGLIVVPSPLDVDAVMRRVPAGQLSTVRALAADLAEAHGAQVGCVVTTGIFATLVARAADEAERSGGTAPTPYWRTLKADGSLNPKYPGGVERQMQRLEAEGHVVVQQGRLLRVQDGPGASPAPARARPARGGRRAPDSVLP